MQIIRTAAEAANIADPELRTLVQKTIAALNPDGSYNPDELGYFLIVQPGDTLAAVSKQIGFDILANRWTGKRFGDADFTPSFEFAVEHTGYWEMVYVLDQAGSGVDVFVPKTSSTDPQLLAMCQRYATLSCGI